ncbi:MAG: hypothetical protein JXB48_05270 [Candidatus Latescibacteria bacterium]|nr:hypothetical protein [Candidatus Latescibacterota bacterium]
MTGRERVICAVEHIRPDNMPVSDSFWEDTLLRWHNEGLPEGISPSEYFDFDIVTMGIDASPGFRAYMIDEDDQYITLQDRFGYVVRKQKGKSRTLDYVSYPANDRAAWEAVKPKFTLETNTSARIDTLAFPFRLEPEPTWQEVREKYQAIRANDKYILASAYGPHEAVWRLHGFTETLIDIVLDTELIMDIAATYVAFLLKVIDLCLKEGITFDGLFIVEDVAATRGMLFSPDQWRAIYKPVMAKIGDFLRDRGLHFWMHSCGNGEAVFGDLIQCGVQVINPLEAKSGLDIRELKKKFGDKLAFYGNINVITMAKSEIEIEHEIRDKLAPFKRSGGYIYHSDHSVPPEVSFERYRSVIEMVRKYGKC